MTIGDLIFARSVSSALVFDAGSLPTEIQWMPPGEHTITAFKNGEPTEMKIKVTAQVAERLTAALQEYNSKVAAGIEDRPYFDFNHNDAEASAHVLSFSWGGDDPVKGGVRAKVEWTEPGKQALLGRAYRRFSPTFYLNAKGEVAGAAVNMGGLVNKAAFKEIAAIWSRDGGDLKQTNKQNQRMAEKTTEQQLAELTTAVAALTTSIGEIKAKMAAPDPKIIVLETEISGIKEMSKVQAKEAAKIKVAAAVAAGKIPPQDTTLIAKWEDLIAIDAKNAELLDKQPVNPALVAVIKAGATGAANGAGAGAGATAGTEAEQFAAEVKAKHAELKDKSKALDAAIAAKPALYKAWRDAFGKPGLEF
jgi:hypothetical protein